MRARSSLPLLAALAGAALLASTAAAQDPDGEPGCVEGNPCEFIVAVDGSGFVDVSVTEFTTGEWLLATVVNHDTSQNHTIALGDHDLDLEVPAGDVEDSLPFRLGAPGNYVMTDSPTGDVVTISVLEEDESDDGSSTGSNGIPGPAPALVVLALGGALAAARRRA